MNTKIGRNSPCWCGSGRKYKKCHLNRGSQPAPSPGEAIQQFSNTRKSRVCLHPEAGSGCQGGIIQAHTIQRGGGLTRIAEKGHVYTLDHLAKILNNRNRFVKLTGVRGASTFTGFCARHDNELFRPIEDFPFTATREQVFLLCYRAIARELYAKRAQVVDIPYLKTLNRGKSIQEQVAIQQTLAAFSMGADQGLQEIEQLKTILDKALLSNQYSIIDYYVLQFDQTPDVLCSGVTNPVYDFGGNLLQDLGNLDKDMEDMMFSAIPTSVGGAVVFGWLNDSNACKRLIQTLDSLTDTELSHAVLRFLFQNIENMCINPKWWNGLAETDRQNLLSRLHDSGSTRIPERPEQLMDDGIRIVNWGNVNRIRGFSQ
jgi:hypothetical protein